MRHHDLVAQRDRGGEVGRRQGAEDRERHLGADALHGLQEAKPFAFAVEQKSEQANLIFPHMGLDRERNRRARGRQRLQGPHRAMHQLADPVDVKDDEILAVGIDDAFQLADHLRMTFIGPPP